MKKLIMVVVSLLTALPVFASDGAIPIWEPTTITEPGRYVLTRNIASSGVTLRIESDDVHLDLNGFTVESSDIAAVLVYSGQLGLYTSRVVIENGTMSGNFTALYLVYVSGLVVRDTRIVGVDRTIYMDDPVEGAVFEANLIEGAHIEADHCTNTSFLDNVIRDSDAACLTISNGSGNSLIRNEIFGCNGNAIDILSGVSKNRIVANRISDCNGDAMRIVSGHNLIRDNLVSNCTGTAVSVAGSYCRIEDNTMTGNGGALDFASSATDNVYRGNVARGNGVDFADSGTNNTSHGDNYMPSQM